MSRGDFLGEFEHLVMLAIARGGGSASGVDIHSSLERIALREASLPAIYVTLARLERKGYVRSEEAPSSRNERAGGRPRRLFAITRAGAVTLRRTRGALERLWSDANEPAADGRGR